MTRRLLLGIGNPILTDDRIGLDVARAVHAELPPGTAELCEVSVGGIELLYVLEGYTHAILIDAERPGDLLAGEVEERSIEALGASSPACNTHHLGLREALALGRACGMKMPERVQVFAIGVRDPYTVSEAYTAEVAAALPRIVHEVLARVEATLASELRSAGVQG